MDKAEHVQHRLCTAARRVTSATGEAGQRLPSWRPALRKAGARRTACPLGFVNGHTRLPDRHTGSCSVSGRWASARSARYQKALAQHFGLKPSERAELLPSGQQGVFKNRLGWARNYMKKAGLSASPKRGVFKVTDLGLQTLAINPPRIDVRYLEPCPQFMAFREASRPASVVTELPESVTSRATPEERIELAHQGLRTQLGQELLAPILACSPSFFEQRMVELRVKMGYGGSRRAAGERIGQTGDGGIDGMPQGGPPGPGHDLQPGQALARHGRAA